MEQILGHPETGFRTSSNLAVYIVDVLVKLAYIVDVLVKLSSSNSRLIHQYSSKHQIKKETRA